jgi:hypothetical protein
VAVDRPQQQLARGASDELEAEVDGGQRRTAVDGERLPVVDAHQGHVLG